MTSTTTLTLDLQRPNISVVAAGKQNDKLSRVISASLFDGDTPFTPGTAHAFIRYKKPDGTGGFYDALEDNSDAYVISGNVITFTLVEQMLTVPGNVLVEVNFYTTTEKLTSFMFLLAVEQSVLTDATIVSSDYYNVLTAEIQAILGAIVNPPYIDATTKNWMLWDQNAGAYVDSGYSSVGTQGEQGPQGYSIGSIAKTSGTGAAGTADTYTAYLNDTAQTPVGSFNVYNGADGQGSPGSATPLTDSGTGVTGTANAYSREDHRHPLNVQSSGTPADLGTAALGTASTYARSDHVHKTLTDKDIFEAPAATTSTYPTTVGIFAVIVDIFANLTPSATYGMLEIIKCSGYQRHLFVDGNGKAYIGFVSSVNGVTEPSTWALLEPVPKTGSITTTTSWTTQTDDYTQTVTVSGATVTANSKVDLQPDTTALTQMLSDGCTALYVENNAGTLTLHALGAAPTIALTIQATVTEVA